ncbi:MAG: 3-isopropylmalate dehydratase [Acidimicrobiales bacterium]|jgi:3-isopropylmalate/(R)-2-methylmalate dehydratase small subunit|nr:3-isopropylmalate dehydratase [Acidimicrobiaceae bacterium]MDP6076666.1 3-isopropylmalate dehydratase [Acidimicrobiales bacterium]MDP7258758.1 3-isopropylmalate dehydratase [Acidimicrobiales bacterium]HCV36143.1 3-isopropylmalate dehydratase [Acidimicrobiaceae bacterium]HJO79935.1 3-isopropylmalate dehydratase [Acidimicrobiales bacterium]|tara:strand:- start:1475 stop:1975 length:501 start_codon:yes stop_codon:yes gene_type:complete
MASDVLRGRTWRLGHDVSTDVLSPGAYAVDPVEIRKLHVLESIIPEFASEVEVGDIIVAGRNFGCGSSRETAAENLKALGVACVVAESLSRLFMRNAIAVGLPALICTGAHIAFDDGDDILVDLAAGRVINTTNGVEIPADPLPEEMRRILASGGILAVLRNQVEA